MRQELFTVTVTEEQRQMLRRALSQLGDGLETNSEEWRFAGNLFHRMSKDTELGVEIPDFGGHTREKAPYRDTIWDTIDKLKDTVQTFVDETGSGSLVAAANFGPTGLKLED